MKEKELMKKLYQTFVKFRPHIHLLYVVPHILTKGKTNFASFF